MGIFICGEAVTETTVFVKDPGYGWGKQGANDHLWHDGVCKNCAYTHHYNEVRVDKGQDVLGTYFMVSGFQYGYSGLQVNSASERRILFSVWSPVASSTINSTAVLNNYQCPNITVKNFGGEGYGAQSFFNYMWKVNVTYAFLMRAEATPANKSTSFTLWIRNGETQKWLLFASFSRPSELLYFWYFYSFNENFYGAGNYPFKDNGGAVSRYGNYGRSFKLTNDSKWVDAFMATFSVDDCGKRKYRLDSSAGLN